MPNYVRNVIKISNIKKEDVSLILNLLASKIEDKIVIDFDKIIPEPRTIDKCPEDCRIESAKEAHIEEDKDRPWFNWYMWHSKYWGTKWEACDGYTLTGKTWIKFIFSTAWSAPTPIILKLSKLGYNLHVRYADEDYGSNCGTITYSRELGWDHTSNSELTNPERFARELWNRY